jgi:hypothetical protein
MTQHCIKVSTKNLNYLLHSFVNMLLYWFSEMSKLVCNFTSVSVSNPTHERAFSQMKHSRLKLCSRITNVHLHDVMWTDISKWERNINPLVEQIQVHVSHWSGSSGYFYLRVQFLVSNSTDIFECSGLCNILHHSMWPACLERLSTHHNYYLSNTRLLVENARVLSPPLAIQ